MGPVFNNIDRLIQKPYGCGEQNMIRLAPNVFVLRYLEAKNEEDADLRARAIRNIKDGMLYRR